MWVTFIRSAFGRHDGEKTQDGIETTMTDGRRIVKPAVTTGRKPKTGLKPVKHECLGPIR